MSKPDWIEKLRILRLMLSIVVDEWRSEIWAKDLDSPYCCSGASVVSPCGCGGQTVRDLYNPPEPRPESVSE